MLQEDDLRKLLENPPARGQQQTSYFVEAGAGAGKSYTICQRILSQLKQGLVDEPEQIVAITFTEKATMELRHKLEAHAADDAANHPESDLPVLVQRVHISTIHSFCRTILSLFPLETHCSLNMKVLSPYEDQQTKSQFFRTYLREDPKGLARKCIAYGCRRDAMENAFMSAVGNAGIAVPHNTVGGPVFKENCKNLKSALEKMHKLFKSGIKGRQRGMSADYLSPDFYRVLNMQTLSDEELLVVKKYLLILCSPNFTPLKLFTPATEKARTVFEELQACEQIERDVNALEKKETTESFSTLEAAQDFLVSRKLMQAVDISDASARQLLKAQILALAPQILPLYQKIKDLREEVVNDTSISEQAIQAESEIGYDLFADLLVDVLSDWEKFYAEQTDCSNDALLTRTRDLLREDADARRILHNRYRCLYLDEFQDTDPVQAEIAFLLTHDEDTYGPETDWAKCHPTPGSLFFVGDPKQAIYRFRGAEMAIYKKVKSLFEVEGVGEYVQLQRNFRSNSEICKYSDDLCEAPMQADTKYQAGYLSMNAFHGSAGRVCVFQYPNFGQGDEKKDEDAEKIARFIYDLVSSQKPYPLSPNQEPLCYSDFLLLTRNKKPAQRYLDALSKYRIPVSFAGERPYKTIAPIVRLTTLLRFLLDSENEVLLLRVLQTHYGLQDFGFLRTLRSEISGDLTALVRFPQAENAPKDGVYAALRPIFEELHGFVEDAKHLSPFALLDKLAASLSGLVLPDDPTDDVSREANFGYLQQFLLQVRAECPYRDFARVAAFAIKTCEEKSIERELPLSPREDCVNIMNLHKAKGLEGRIVILLMDGGGAPPISSVTYTDDKGVYSGVFPLYSKMTGWSSIAINYAPSDWETRKKADAEANKAENLRLKYVAATRAMDLLLIASGGTKPNGKSSWWGDMAKIAAPLPEEPSKAPDTASAANADPAKPAKKSSKKTKKSSGPQYDADQIFKDWGHYFDILSQDTLATPYTPQTTVATVPPHPFTDAQKDLDDLRAQLSALRLAHISPSALDKSHPVKSDAADPDAPPAQVDLTDVPAQDEPQRFVYTPPYGADWGTMVHRSMELLVQVRPADSAAAFDLFRRAAVESIPSDHLTALQQRQLFGEQAPDSYEKLVSQLAEHIQAATAFWFDAAHPLRRLTDTGDACPEYPFHLRIDPSHGALYTFIQERLKMKPAHTGPISVSGILDLAVLRDDGWYIIDYKTDGIRADEAESAYRRRLAEEYSAQLNAYVRVLESLSDRPVQSADLCSIPLQGAFISIYKK